MGIMPDSWIRKMALEKNMIDPFIDKLEKQNVLSYGLSSMDTTLEFLVILKSLPMLTLLRLTLRNFQNQVLLIEM